MIDTESGFKVDMVRSNVRNINIVLLFTHVLLLCIFCYLNIKIMVLVNVISILIYLNLFSAVRTEDFFKYLVTAYFEVSAHMIIAAFAMGWDCGFQLYIFPLIAGIFYTIYFERDRKVLYIRSLTLSVVYGIAFIVIRIITYFNIPYYHLDDMTKLIILLVNIVIVFVFLITFLVVLVKTAFKAESKFENLAHKDELTKLYNRHMMTAILDDAYEDAKEYQMDFFIAILDIDDFKKINDTYGHNIGDCVLAKIGDILNEFDDSNTIVCRWGGEEFLILLDDTYNLERVYQKVTKISDRIKETRIECGDEEISVTISGGVGQFKRERTLYEIIQTADTNLYKAKVLGKDCVVGMNGLQI